MIEADIVRAAIFPIMLAGAILIWRAKRQVAGRLLVLIGSLHLIGAWVGRDPLRRIAERGFFDQADSAVGHVAAVADQELVFWFLLWGVVTIVLGQLTIAMERRDGTVPRWIGFELLVVNLVCCVLMPKGGFWWVLLPAWLIARPSGH
jgi:Family of unknown function (DUF6463)